MGAFPAMKGNREQQKSTDRQCQHCGLWFDVRGHKSHERNCDFEQYDRRIIPLENEDGDPGDEKGPTPQDGVGDTPTPEGSTPNDDPARTDGAGLGLEGPPETTTDDNGGENMNCCDSPDLEEIPEGTDVDLDNGVTITTEAGDKFCTNCQAVVEADGGRIVR
ncbi:hypothetical protein EI982_09455 [Haloplanus rallus]|uniref:Uncharacterized protein n=1 Tax=Haloplanus rallus TaxID=1816183 RepID=A0A6B9FE69_9EURY|nr:hypothetical protein [Haloplanus rallus]QGX95000.1 hypothetical protein EI982_09455 [Haloplanus rallus]